jgi:hypothetical protein
MTWPLQSICVTNDHGYVQFIVITIRSFPHSWLITRILTRLTWWVPLLEREMFTILEHLSSSQFFVLLNHQFSVCYLVGHCLSFHSFSLVIVCPSIIMALDYPFGTFKFFLWLQWDEKESFSFTFFHVYLYLHPIVYCI